MTGATLVVKEKSVRTPAEKLDGQEEIAIVNAAVAINSDWLSCQKYKLMLM